MMNRDVARQFILMILENDKEDLLSDSSQKGIEHMVSQLQNELDEFWFYQLYNGETPAPDSELSRNVDYWFESLLKEAKVSPYAYEGALLIATNLTDNNRRLNPLLSVWLAAHLKGDISKPRRHGKSKFSNWGRDLCIAKSVEVLVDKGFVATRSDTSPHNSACDIVAEVLISDFNMSVDFETVKKIWNKYKD